MTVHIENLKEFTEQLLKLICKFIMAVDYVNVQKNQLHF